MWKALTIVPGQFQGGVVAPGLFRPFDLQPGPAPALRGDRSLAGRVLNSSPALRVRLSRSSRSIRRSRSCECRSFPPLSSMASASGARWRRAIARACSSRGSTPTCRQSPATCCTWARRRAGSDLSVIASGSTGISTLGLRYPASFRGVLNWGSGRGGKLSGLGHMTARSGQFHQGRTGMGCSLEKGANGACISGTEIGRAHV